MLDVLNIYLIDKAPKHSDPTITRARVMTLGGLVGRQDARRRQRHHLPRIRGL